MKKRITAISLMLVLILILTACGSSDSTSESEPFQMPFGLNYGDSNETVKDAMSEVGTLELVDEYANTGKSYSLADKETYSYLGYDWLPECSVNEDKLFLITMWAYISHDDYDVIISKLEKQYGEPNTKNEENTKTWEFENERILCEFRPKGEDNDKEYVILMFFS